MFGNGISEDPSVFIELRLYWLGAMNRFAIEKLLKNGIIFESRHEKGIFVVYLHANSKVPGRRLKRHSLIRALAIHVYTHIFSSIQLFLKQRVVLDLTVRVRRFSLMYFFWSFVIIYPILEFGKLDDRD